MLEQTDIVIALFALGVSLSVALVVWLVAKAISEVPPEDREYKDAPPTGFRIVWWPIQWLSFFLAPWLRGKRYEASRLNLRKAGLEYSLSPAQFASGRIICAACVAALFWWLFGSFDPVRRGGEPFALSAYVQFVLAGFALGYLYPRIWLRDRIAARRAELLKTFPFFLDIITLCVEAGLNFPGAMRQAVLKGPKGVLRDEFMRVIRDIRAGESRADSLRAMAERLNEGSITNFVGAIIQAEIMGVNLGPVLRAQADHRRIERFLRAEKRAMEAPVKMLFPLIIFIFPCTFGVLAFPLAVQLASAGW